MHRQLVLWLLVIGISAGCQTATPTPDFESSTRLELTVTPSPPTVGAAELIVSLRAPDDSPVDGAQIALRGDMDQPNVAAVLRDVNESDGGDYRTAFEWTQPGEWYVVVTATLPDGTIVERQFDYTVAPG